MKAMRLPVAIAVLVLLACGTVRNTPQPTKELEGSWQLAVFMPEQKKTLAEWFGGRTVELQFNQATAGVTGTTGCNRFAGRYKADTTHLTFSANRILTKMACGPYNEQRFLTALDRVNRYRLVESQLELLRDSTIIMIFAKKLP